MNIDLPVYRFRFEFEALDKLTFPHYAGSTWRGLFGKVLRRSLCVTRAQTCEGCLLRQQCVYSAIFESPPPVAPVTILSQSPDIPRPYVICPLETSGGVFAVGERFSIELRLIGHSVAHFPYIVHTLQQMGGVGVGMRSGQGRFALKEVWQVGHGNNDQGDLLFEGAGALAAVRDYQPVARLLESVSAVRLEFITPYRSQLRGELLRADGFNGRQLITTVARRVSMLQAFHGKGEPDADYALLAALGERLEIRQAALRWHNWTRYSSRQKDLIKMGGILGSVELHGEALSPLLALLQKGEEVHVGKAAVMGLGGYRLSAV